MFCVLKYVTGGKASGCKKEDVDCGEVGELFFAKCETFLMVFVVESGFKWDLDFTES